MTQVHQSAQSGYSKASETYASGRPGYPAMIDGWLQDTLFVGPGKRVVDLGAGTGKFTAHLVQSGADVTAIEPVLPMLDKLQKAFPEVDARQGNSTKIPLENDSVDAVFCAQAFHWFATVETLEEIARVLKPKGILALVWNVRDETCDWVAGLSRIMAPYEEGTPRFHHGQWRSVFPDAKFSQLQDLTFDHAHCGDFDTVVVDRIMSVSFIAALPQKKRDDVEQKIRELQNCFPSLSDKTGICFAYKTFVTWTEKL